MESTSSSNYRVVKEVECVCFMEFVGFDKQVGCSVKCILCLLLFFVCVDPSEVEQIVCFGGHLWQEE